LLIAGRPFGQRDRVWAGARSGNGASDHQTARRLAVSSNKVINILIIVILVLLVVFLISRI
jgi:hypothetical protein